MKPERWTAQNVKLDAEAKFAAERQLVARQQAAKLKMILIAVAVAGALATVGAAFIRFEAAAITGAFAVTGGLVCGYFWTGARNRANLAARAISNAELEQKQWRKQRPRDMV